MKCWEKLQQKIPKNASGQVCAPCLCDLILQIQAIISMKQKFVDSEAEYFSFFFVLKKHFYIEKNLQCNSLLVATSKPARLTNNIVPLLVACFYPWGAKNAIWQRKMQRIFLIKFLPNYGTRNCWGNCTIFMEFCNHIWAAEHYHLSTITLGYKPHNNCDGIPKYLPTLLFIPAWEHKITLIPNNDMNLISASMINGIQEAFIQKYITHYFIIKTTKDAECRLFWC